MWFPLTHNSNEWYEARAGMATTSSFSKILTASGKPSRQMHGYANQVITELILGHAVERQFSSYALDWGLEHESDACDLYSFDTDLDVAHGGFFTNDKFTWGSSPDVICKKDGKQVGIAEIKCPENPIIHVEFLLRKEINSVYKPQVQGQLLLTGFEWCDWFSYYPGMPANRIRVYRDEEYISKLEEALNMFDEVVEEKLKRLEQLGHIDEIPKKFIKARKEKIQPELNPEYLKG